MSHVDPKNLVIAALDRHQQERDITATIRQHAAMKPGWYVSALGVRIGPLETRDEAREAVRLTPRARAVQRLATGTDYPFPADMKVWEEK